MAQPSKQEERTAQIVQEAERTIAEANKALARADQFFAQHGHQLRLVRQQMTPAMEAEVKRQVDELTQQVRQEVANTLLHQKFSQADAYKPRRVRSMV